MFANFKMKVTCNEKTITYPSSNRGLLECLASKKADFIFEFYELTRKENLDSHSFTFALRWSHYRMYMKPIEKANIDRWFDLLWVIELFSCFGT